MKKAFLIDPFSSGNYHEVINMSYLYLISKCYDEVVYVCDKSSYDNCMEKLAAQGLHVDNAKNIHIKSKHYKNRKYWGSINYCRYHFRGSLLDILYYLKSEKGADVFYNNNILCGLNFLNFISRYKKNRLFVMCHSEINIVEKENIGYGEVITRFLLRRFLKGIISPKMSLIVLGDDIRRNILNHANPVNAERVKSMDHSYFRVDCDVNPYKFPDSNRNLKIGIPSLINKNRGLDKLIYLLENKTGESRFDIYAIGRVVSDKAATIDNLPLIQLNKSSELMPASKYSSYTSAMDAMILFVPHNKFGASGGVLEAIWEQKIILSLNNGYISYMFEKYGKMGYIFDSVEDMSDFLNNHLNDIEKSKPVFLENLRKAKEALYPANMVDSFKVMIS